VFFTIVLGQMTREVLAENRHWRRPFMSRLD
jgi:hypothetical protein